MSEKKIKGHHHCNNTSFERFNRDLESCINNLQDDEQEVEIQYKMSILPNGQPFYDALILGRVKNDFNKVEVGKKILYISSVVIKK